MSDYLISDEVNNVNIRDLLQRKHNAENPASWTVDDARELEVREELFRARRMIAERDAVIKAVRKLANRGKTVYEHYETQPAFAGFEIREALGKFATEGGA